MIHIFCNLHIHSSLSCAITIAVATPADTILFGAISWQKFKLFPFAGASCRLEYKSLKSEEMGFVTDGCSPCGPQKSHSLLFRGGLVLEKGRLGNWYGVELRFGGFQDRG
jgi:hypothetical protein